MQNKTNFYFAFYMIFRTFEVNLEGTFTRKCKIKLIYFVFCSFIRTFAWF